MTALLPNIPGHHAGATRDEAVRTITGNGGPDLAERNTRKARYIGKHRADDAPTEVIPVIEVEILALIVDLDALGADVRTVQRDPNGVCRFSGLPNDVAIYDGDDYADECRECAPAAVEAATSDAVVVEIATGPEATL